MARRQVRHVTARVVVAATVAFTAVLVALALHQPAARGHAQRPVVVLGQILGIASPCEAMNVAISPVPVEALRGTAVVSRATASFGGQYHYELRVPPGDYVVRAGNGLHADVVVAAGRASRLDLMPGCKSLAL